VIDIGKRIGVGPSVPAQRPNGKTQDKAQQEERKRPEIHKRFHASLLALRLIGETRRMSTASKERNATSIADPTAAQSALGSSAGQRVEVNAR